MRRSRDRAKVRAQRRSVEPVYGTRSTGRERRRDPEHPDLVPDLVEEALPGVGVRRAERGRLVHDDAGRAEQAGAAAQQPGGELEVVVPQEVVRLRQAALPAHAGVHEDRHKRGRTDRQASGAARPRRSALAGQWLGAGGVHGVRAPVGPHHPAGDQRGRRAGITVTGVQHRPQRARLGHRVVVHEPDQVRVARQRERHAAGEPARAAGVARELGQLARKGSARAPPRRSRRSRRCPPRSRHPAHGSARAPPPSASSSSCRRLQVTTTATTAGGSGLAAPDPVLRHVRDVPAAGR